MVLAAPTVTSPTATAITPYTATLGGNVTSDGGANVFKRGIVYSVTIVNPNPSINGLGVTEVDAAAGTGVFTANVIPLTPTAGYSYKAFATNADGTTYTSVATFAAQAPNLIMPPDSIPPNDQDPQAALNTVLYFAPAKTGPQFTIPDKTITFTNNTSKTVFPILTDTNSTLDTKSATIQALYDPIDPIWNEFRGYIGYKNGDGNFLGLPPGMAITIKVPLVFWDGARIFIGTDSTYMDMINTNAQVKQSATIPNPFQYYAKNQDGSPTKHAVLPAVSMSGEPEGTTGVVMWYRQGLDIKNDSEPIGPANDAPAQLAEFTIRDTILSTINPHIDELFPNHGETHALFNYDVSYVDNMTLPVAMEALDVPVPITDPPVPPLVVTPFPGPRLPYGWVGSAQTVDQFEAALRDFLKPNDPVNGLGSYFNGNGWTQYNFTVSNNGSPAFATPPLIKIPSAQDALADSPLGDISSNYDLLANSYMLTSNGAGPKAVVGGAGGTATGTNAISFTQGTIDLNQQKLRSSLVVGMVVGSSTAGYSVPANTKVTGITYQTEGDPTTPIVGVTTDGPVPETPNGQSGVIFTFTRPVTDYLSTRLVNLWYTWANYYVTQVALDSNAQNQQGISGKAIPDSAKPAALNNVIQLDSANTHLVPGMVVTGAGISTNPSNGKTTIISIDADNRTLHLSQGVTIGAVGTYDLFLPSWTSNPSVAGFDPSMLLTPFNPVATVSVPDVKQFAQNAYQLLSFMSQVPADPKSTAPVSVQVVHNVIGGNVTKPTNLDGLHKIEVSFRTMVKSLLRGVNDFNLQLDQKLWYPDPSLHPVGGQDFNIFNMDPFVWFVHQRLGLSGYGFSLDDDAADIGAIYATKLGVSIGGLNGLPNQFEWTQQAPFGPVSDNATVTTLALPFPTHQPPYTQPYQIAGLPTNVFYSVTPLDTANATPAALVSGPGVASGAFLNSFGDGGLGATSYGLDTPDHSPALGSPLVVGSNSQFTFYGAGTPNTSPLTLSGGVTEANSPYSNTSTVTIPAASSLKIKTDIGNLTSYTQQLQQIARVKTQGEDLPPLNTIINGSLDAGRVDIVDGYLSGTGTINGSVELMGPVNGYKYRNSLGDIVTILPTKGGFLLPGSLNKVPGKLTIGSMSTPGDVSMYGGTISILARGATSAGADYSQLVSYGKVSLGNSVLDLSVINNYTPKAGDTLTVITAAGGVTGRFKQDTSITVHGFHFTITYNANNVVLTYVPQFGSQGPPPQPPAIVAVGSGPGDGPNVRVYTADGNKLLFNFIAYDPSFMGGVRVAVADVNMDGAPDIITAPGPGGGPHIKIFSGKDLSLLGQFMAYDANFSGGVFVGVGNFDSDPALEIVTGAGPGGSPHVRIFDINGAQIAGPLGSFLAYDAGFRGGVSVAGGNFDGSPGDEVITGAGPGGGPHVKAFRQDGTLAASFFAYSAGFTGGVEVASADTDNDGLSEIITGAGAGGGPHVKVFNGGTATEIGSFFAYADTFHGGVHVGAVDRNGDGRIDILTGPGALVPNSSSVGSLVRTFDGPTLGLLDELFAFDPAFQDGVFVN